MVKIHTYVLADVNVRRFNYYDGLRNHQRQETNPLVV